MHRLTRIARAVTAAPAFRPASSLALRSSSAPAARLLPLAALAFVATAASTAMSAPIVESTRAKRAEELYNTPTHDRRELLTHLQAQAHEDPRDAGILWRLARAAYDVAGLASTAAAEKKELTYFAHETIQKALALADDNFAVQKWCR
ncbi:hypothetical protein SDRG_07055 [Saprolegnia diclina VS20]|uniref:Uncharacterized protein n=1 Tax=Saprolegnia diclina (strain VS20) TaxID=1156394 RepID=T0RS27_SAPDV|nr:hypothetical protein SDRG_07055 [Saprolegnia diclina VS20]EQC35343.1 hypothetical protein SDRG_07055 [Saprolegnia diclina VS20]|eukprot:XP_008611093.1 hypothetical protein SDRG_07055 [Saprolegnia diclina VS20]